LYKFKKKKLFCSMEQVKHDYDHYNDQYRNSNYAYTMCIKKATIGKSPRQFGDYTELLACYVFGLKHIGRDRGYNGDVINGNEAIIEIKTSAPKRSYYSISGVKSIDKRLLLQFYNRDRNIVEFYYIRNVTEFIKTFLSYHSTDSYGHVRYRGSFNSYKYRLLQKYRVSCMKKLFEIMMNET